METDQLLNLRKFLVPEIVYGEGAIQLSGRHAENFGASKVFIVTDPGVRAAKWTDEVEKSLDEHGIEYTVFDNITSNPKDYEVMEGAELCSENDCDLIIAVGGGSPMDCAKGIGVIIGNDGHILDFEGVDTIPEPGPPLIFIPTTAGTSADVSQFAIITDTKRGVKIAIISKMVIPDIALIDPRTTLTMSRDLTAATGMDALCHAFEAYVSNASSPLTDMAAFSAVGIISEYLEKAYNEPDNILFRDRMMTASLMAGIAFSNASLGLVHAMAHSLGGAKGLPHGECNAILLEKIVKYNYSSQSAKYDKLAEGLGLNINGAKKEERADLIHDHILGLRKRLNVDIKLSELGVEESDIEKLAGFAMNDPCLATNPKEPEIKDIENLYMQVF